MSNVPVARRYARALLDVAGAQADQLLEQIEGLSTSLGESPELFAALASPTLTKTQRMSVLDAVSNSVPGVNPLLANLLRLLTDRNRFASLPFITRQYRDMVDSRMGRVRGRVTSAAKLADPQVQALKKQLEALTQRSVVLDTAVDPSLLGGVVATVGSFQYDGSVKQQLATLARSLSAR